MPAWAATSSSADWPYNAFVGSLETSADSARRCETLEVSTGQGDRGRPVGEAAPARYQLFPTEATVSRTIQLAASRFRCFLQLLT